MFQQFNCVNGSSYSDVCLNTYGSLDYYVKLLNDNNLQPNNEPYSGQAIMWDPSLVTDESIQQQTSSNNTIYATYTGYSGIPVIPATMSSTIDIQVIQTQILQNTNLIVGSHLQSSASQTVSVLSVTTGNLQIKSNEFVHDDVAGTVAITSGTILAAGDTVTVTIKVAQTTVGVANGTITSDATVGVNTIGAATGAPVSFDNNNDNNDPHP